VFAALLIGSECLDEAALTLGDKNGEIHNQWAILWMPAGTDIARSC
jgi:hypothetical protein